MAIPKLDLQLPQGVTVENAGEKFLAHARMLLENPEEMRKREELAMGNPISLSPPVLTEDEWDEKQIGRTISAADEWEKRTLNPRKDPVKAAIAANEKRKRNLEEAERKDKWLKAMEQVDMESRQKTIKAVGATGFRRGIEARKDKIKNKIKRLRPLVLANKEVIQAMAQDTPEQREDRMLTNLRNMRKIGDELRNI